MSLAPRCPQCRVPLRITQLCVVCEAGIVVQRVDTISSADMAFQAPVPVSVAPVEAPSPEVRVTPPQMPPPQVQVSCGEPGCSNQATYHPAGLRRLQARGEFPRCTACKQERRHVSMTSAWKRYQAKHHQQPSSV